MRDKHRRILSFYKQCLYDTFFYNQRLFDASWYLWTIKHKNKFITNKTNIVFSTQILRVPHSWFSPFLERPTKRQLANQRHQSTQPTAFLLRRHHNHIKVFSYHGFLHITITLQSIQPTAFYTSQSHQSIQLTAFYTSQSHQSIQPTAFYTSQSHQEVIQTYRFLHINFANQYIKVFTVHRFLHITITSKYSAHRFSTHHNHIKVFSSQVSTHHNHIKVFSSQVSTHQQSASKVIQPTAFIHITITSKVFQLTGFYTSQSHQSIQLTGFYTSQSHQSIQLTAFYTSQSHQSIQLSFLHITITSNTMLPFPTSKSDRHTVSTQILRVPCILDSLLQRWMMGIYITIKYPPLFTLTPQQMFADS